MIFLDNKVTTLPGIGPVVAKDFKKLEIITIRDLLLYFPFRYEDLSKVSSIEDLVPDEVATVQGRVVNMKARRSSRKRMMLTEGIVEDDTGRIKVVWFNQPYLAKSFRPGIQVSLSGRVDDKYGLSLVNPIYEILKSNETVHTGRIVPVYPLTGSLTGKRLRNAIHTSLKAAGQMEDWLPDELLDNEDFLDLPTSIRTIHYPSVLEELEAAIRRMKFDELFLHQLMFARAREEQASLPAHAMNRDKKAENRFKKSFPFDLTKAQDRSVDEILNDLTHDNPMNRLLEGDVGSGKSAVAACALEACARAMFQAAYLAPTEILAKQQYEEMKKVLSDYRVALLTRSEFRISDSDQVSKDEIKDELSSGKIDVVVATHALLQDGYKFSKLGLLVIDEQHRFGVKQRQELIARSGDTAPHLLSMSATPIPRSLALSVYGDLDLSILDELPAGRKPIDTKIVTSKNMSSAIKLMDVSIKNGQQVYAVCPLIDPSDKLGATSVTEFSDELKSGPLKKHRIEILHGKLKTADKQDVIDRFVAGAIDILVSTTVVEVGVNVPNATVMYIEGADRFGLAQLHQLRGRVGRSDLKSFCLLHTESSSGKAPERLEAMVKSQDGFELAEKDLELRGAGNIFGTAQSGFADFKLATLADVDIMKKARDWAQKVMNKGLKKYPGISDRLEAEYHEVHFE